ncbi:hypothetical protein BJX63DRAFT_437586 [Aspergillus granulosus]|uniref:Uncharacterized protein n=1 Tax=Aspergillus granulosus TaxID=176169 RepID=A0ABR4GV33_9EURO
MATDPESLRILDWTNPDTERLFDKAINSPSEITEEEKHKIAEWIPSRSEMEVRTQKYLQQSLNNLFEAAATDKESLTYPQFLMIDQGFHLLGRLDTVGRNVEKLKRARVQPQLHAKWKQAREVVLSEIELRAVLNIEVPDFQLRLVTEYSNAKNQARREARSRPAPWIQRVIDQGGEKSWGYVIYCLLLDDSPEWKQFQRRFEEIVCEYPVAGLGAEEIRQTKVTDFIRFDGNQGDFGQVRENFRALREQGRLKPGVLSNVVLYVTPECHTSCDDPDTMYSWLWALDPDWSLDGPDEEGYEGRLPVNWGICYDTFYNFLSMDRWSLKDIWSEYNQMRKQRRIPGWVWTNLDKPQWPDC